MALLTDSERKPFERLAAEGKATRLLDEEPATAKTLEGDGFELLVGGDAIITPKGRRLPAGEEQEQAKKTVTKKPPPSLLE